MKPEILRDSFFNEKGIYNYHGGASILFDDEENLNRIIFHKKAYRDIFDLVRNKFRFNRSTYKI